MHIETRVEPRPSRTLVRASPVRTPIALRSCPACHVPTTLPWFCGECQERASPHREDDPYDELGDGEPG